MANTAHTTLEVTPRHLWLALLGGAGLARRQLSSGLCVAGLRARQVGTVLRAGSEDARNIAWGVWLTAQEKLAKQPHRATRRRAR